MNGEPLIGEVPQAWDNGPVFRTIWDHIKDHGYQGRHNTLVDPQTDAEISEELTETETKIIEHVWKKYGHLTASRLSKLTHEPNTPWEKAYFGRGRNATLDLDEIRDHYIELAMAGRDQAA